MNVAVLVTVAVVVSAGWWAWDVWRRPYKRHWACKGTGRVHVRGNRYDLCTGCDGGRVKSLRVGARWVHPKLKNGK